VPLYKLGISLLLGVIAALIVFISALLSDARIMTVLLRSVISFLLVTAVLFLALWVLEMKNILGLDKNIELPEDEPTDEKLRKMAEEAEASGSEDADTGDEEQAAASSPQDSGGEDAFQPLRTEDMQHVSQAEGQNS
jgi:hypothetical protein